MRYIILLFMTCLFTSCGSDSNTAAIAPKAKAKTAKTKKATKTKKPTSSGYWAVMKKNVPLSETEFESISAISK